MTSPSPKISPKSVLALVVPVAALLLADGADARGYRIDQVPGGYEIECYMCHFRRPFTRLTDFGILVRETLLFRDDYPEELPDNLFVGDEGNVDWATVALLDSDGDGYTNGEELGDPEGLFVQNDPQPAFPFTRPDLIDDFPCGSGTVEGPEACDGDAFADATCADFDFPGGSLRCRDDCTIDTADCNHCGDGVLDPDEMCDGAVDALCPDGLIGEVRCVECRLDESGCFAPPVDAAAPDMAIDAAAPDMALPDMAPPDMRPQDVAPPDAAPPDMAAADMAPLDLAVDAAAPDAAAGGAGDVALDAAFDAGPDAADPSVPPAEDDAAGCSAWRASTGSSGIGWALLALGWLMRRRHGQSTAVSRSGDGVASA